MATNEKKKEYMRNYREMNKEVLYQKKRQKYSENKDLINQKRKEQRLEKIETFKLQAKIRYYKHREKKLVEMAEFRKKNFKYFVNYRQINKERISKRVKNWCQNNRDKRQSYWNNYRATKLRATPKWLTKEDKDKILEFYTESVRRTKETGIKHHVDHIMPLNGKDFIGLHVPWNLQVLTASENSSKSNKNIEDYSSVFDLR